MDWNAGETGGWRPEAGGRPARLPSRLQPPACRLSVFFAAPDTALRLGVDAGFAVLAIHAQSQEWAAIVVLLPRQAGAAVFAFSVQGLAPELHQSNLDKRKAPRFNRRALVQPIASEPVRRFGLGPAAGATPPRIFSLAKTRVWCHAQNRQPIASSRSEPQKLSKHWGPPQCPSSIRTGRFTASTLSGCLIMARMSCSSSSASAAMSKFSIATS